MLKNNPVLDFTVINTIKDIPQDKWNNLFGEKIIESYGYQKTLEESNLKEFSIKYLLGKSNGNLMAIIPFFVMEFSFTTIVRGPLQKIILFLQKRIKNFLKMKILFVGSPTTEQLYLGISKDQNQDEIFGAVLNELNELSKKEKVNTLLFYNLTKEHQALAKYLAKKGFAVMENFPGAIMEINAGSIEDYISGLGKSTRKDVRRKLRKSSSLAVLKTEMVENVENLISDIYKLYLNNFNESDIHFEIFTPEFFINICRNMPGMIKCFITKDRDKIVAFNICLVKNDFCIDKIIGLDYDVAHKYSLYYTTFCYNIDWCIKNGIRFYQPGQGDYDAKIRLGAQLIPLYIYIKTLNPILNLFIKPILKSVAPKNFDPALKNLEKYKKNVFGVNQENNILLDK